MAIGSKIFWTLRIPHVINQQIMTPHQSMPHHRSMSFHRSVYVNSVVNSNVYSTVHGYPGGSKPTLYPSKRALARQRRAVLKKASQVADPLKQLGTSPMGVEAVAQDSSGVPHGDQVGHRCEIEAPLDPRILKDEKRGTPGHHSHFTINERSNGKTDITFELRTVKNLRRSIKGKMALFTCTVLSTLLFTTLFTWTDR
ncbi:hypothetical protein CUMW_238700 [Citrus unshiu]|uniref:Uncharacterized protein n=1 Tax=Citrus unshiu TaxID=55188 RepID=A0A2H5QKF5_CITUN|nr:hypothetical protein CUMW_238700 [Citrus unshiu]